MLSACSENNTNTYSLPEVSVGDTFEITLDARGGTAYRWEYSITPSTGIEYVDMEFDSEHENDSDWAGGGKLTYKFKAVKAGEYTIKFELLIPNQSKPPIETNVYKIKIKA